MSIMLPKISPDGRFLSFCMAEYGSFPEYQPTSDLYLMDMETGKYEKLAVNSEFAESYHTFSDNSRWIVFASKRLTGTFARLFISYLDRTGKAYKPFILPQKDPAFYDAFTRTYSLPELVTGPVCADIRRLTRNVRSSDKIHLDVPITTATPIAESSESYSQNPE